MSRNLPPCLCVIVDAPEIITASHRRECPVEGKNLKTMPGQIEFANDLRTEQGNDVRANREFEAGKNFFRHRRPAENLTALKHEHALARAREIRRVHKTVVATADDDAVVFVVQLAKAVWLALPVCGEGWVGLRRCLT